jgi:hypothetical protein
MSRSPDRLYELLSSVHRKRDAEHGFPLRALLRVIAEQVDVVEDDIGQLYEDLFIETCQDWVVPYIGDLIGYEPVLHVGEHDETEGPRRRQRIRILTPRREVANTIPYRRRKGTLAILELLAADVAGWPARAVEFFKLLGMTQAINHLRLSSGQTAELRRVEALDRIGGPFNELSHTVDVRRISSRLDRGLYNIPAVGLFIFRQRVYPVTEAPAYCMEEAGPHCYTFSALANDTRLFAKPSPEPDATHIAEESNLPVPIRRRAFERRIEDYYGEGKSLQIWIGQPTAPGSSEITRKAVPASQIVVADLSNWYYRPNPGQVAVDVELGRIAFPPRQLPQDGVWTSYHYGFSDDLGGGEYDRPQPQLSTLAESLFQIDDIKDPAALAVRLQTPEEPIASYLRGKCSPRTLELLGAYKGGGSRPAEGLLSALLLELNQSLSDDAFYDNERFKHVTLPEATKRLLHTQPEGDGRIRVNRWLIEAAYPKVIATSFALYRVGAREELRRINDALKRWKAEEPRRAVIEITDSGVYVEAIDIELGRGQSLEIRAGKLSRPVIMVLDWEGDRPDWLSIQGGAGSEIILDGLMITGRSVLCKGDIAAVTIRHSTLVPGWGLRPDCSPRRTAVPSLEIFDLAGRVTIEHSILGSIQLTQDEVRADPAILYVSDSVIDAMSSEREAIGGPGCPVAHARLTIERCTVLGQVQVHAIELAENSIFEGLIMVARRQLGCMRFCSYVKGSRTPRRFHCQPDLAEQAVEAELRGRESAPGEDEVQAAKEREHDRVRPQFNSRRYGTPAYCQLSASCAEEVHRGADDESELGVFHDLYQPQRIANLRARLEEHTPAGMEAGLIFAS